MRLLRRLRGSRGGASKQHPAFEKLLCFLRRPPLRAAPLCAPLILNGGATWEYQVVVDGPDVRQLQDGLPLEAGFRKPMHFRPAFVHLEEFHWLLKSRHERFKRLVVTSAVSGNDGIPECSLFPERLTPFRRPLQSDIRNGLLGVPGDPRWGWRRRRIRKTIRKNWNGGG